MSNFGPVQSRKGFVTTLLCCFQQKHLNDSQKRWCFAGCQRQRLFRLTRSRVHTKQKRELLRQLSSRRDLEREHLSRLADSLRAGGQRFLLSPAQCAFIQLSHLAVNRG